MAYENSVYEYNENGELCVRVTGAGGSGGGDVSSVNGKTGVVVLNASDVGAIPQYSQMPEPNQAGDIVQYVGETTENYTNGYFYKSVSDGQDPATYSWTELSMGGLGVYKDDLELPESTEENVGATYLVAGYDSETGTPYNPVIYMSVPYIVNFIDGEAEVTGYGLRPDTQPTGVMINWATLESYLNSQETGFDWTNDTINISLNGENFLEVMYNADYSASAGVQTDGTVANVQQALENMGISVDLTGYTDFQFIYLKLPTEKGYENRQVPGFVPASGPEENGYVLKADGNGLTHWAAEAGGLPDQYQQDGKFLMTDGSNVSWESALRNTSTGNNSLTIEGTPTSETTGTNVGKLSRAEGAGTTAYGWYAEARAEGATAVGSGATVKDLGGIALGRSAETRDGGFVIALWDSQKHEYKMCDLSGHIPTARLTKVNSTITLTLAGWSSNTQTVSVTGMTADGVVMVSPAPADQSAYTAAGVLCTAQAAGTLTFSCDIVPSGDLSVNVVML